MSQRQRIIVRSGVSSGIPALKIGELGFDTDTLTFRIGDDTNAPMKLMTTKSSGDFDFSSTDTVTFNNVAFAPGGGIGGIDLAELSTAQGIVISLGGGSFRQTTIASSDGSVVVSNPKGQSGNIDLKVSTASIQNALGDIRNQLTQISDELTQIELDNNDRDDSFQKLVQLTGEPANTTDLGTFLGSIIPDNSTIRTALQALETAFDDSNTTQFQLQLIGRQINQWGLQLTAQNTVTFTGATETLAGLLVGADKQKLDHITVSEDINLDTLFTIPYTGNVATVNIPVSNGQTLIISGATHTAAGVMSAADKIKADFITITQAVNLDQLEATVNNLASNSSAAYLIETNTILWQSSIAQTSISLPLTTPGLQAFEVVYDRVTDGVNSRFYDAIVLNGITIVESEHVTKSYTGSVTIFKSKNNNNWYYLNNYQVGTLLAVGATTSVVISASTTNSVTVKQLVIS